MSETAIVWTVILMIVVACYYNSLIRKKNQVDNAFASIDVMLKKRYDLIPSLVGIVKVYMQHERELLTEVTELRARFLSTDLTSDEKIRIDEELRTKLDKISLSIENYPELKAGKSFLHLQKTWNETEGHISAARRFFNTAVTEYNNRIEQFPSNLLAKLMGYRRKLVFEIPEIQRRNIDGAGLFNA